MLPSFDEIYTKVEECSSENAFHQDEALCLYNEAKKLTKNQRVVELGIEWGRSTTILAELAKSVGFHHLAIDNFSQDEGEKYRQFQYNRKNEYNWFNTEIKEMDSARSANYFKKKASLLLIDADHEYESVRKDSLAWLPNLKLGGIVMYHDYGRDSLPGVYKAVRELMAENRINYLYSVHWLGVFQKI